SNTAARYVWSPAYVDALVLRDRDTDSNGTLDERLWAQQDANWDLTALVNGSGVAVERYAYDPFGARTVYDGSYTVRTGGTAYANPIGFQGLRQDGPSGLLEADRRWYSPTLGRWTALDPIVYLAGDGNLYRFVGNEPTGATDPSGLAPPGNAGPSGKDDAPSIKSVVLPTLPPAPRPQPLPGQPKSDTSQDPPVKKPDWDLPSGPGHMPSRGEVLRGGKPATTVWEALDDVLPPDGTPWYGYLVFWADQGSSLPMAGGGGGLGVVRQAGGRLNVVSRIHDSTKLVREAEAAGKSAQASLDSITRQLANGNLNPGIGTKPIGGGISESRARDGARVYWRLTADGRGVEVLGKSTKDNQGKVVDEVLKEFGSK
ncbi:MAG: RHS repeat-associated core domain-containing protein, partial [Gemmataceae bacterium]|nr:RHS repeat-associated core domain-containing protein [Gemmataceae bacterium]